MSLDTTSAAPFDPGAGGLGNALRGGQLPEWGGWAAFAGSAAIAALVLIAVGSFTIPAFIAIALVLTMVSTYAWSRTTENARRAKDRLVTLSIVTAFGIALAPLISLLYQVIHRGLPGLNSTFLSQDQVGVIGAGGGAFHALIGTLIVTACATVIAVPIGIMAAIYLVEYGKGRLRRGLTFFVDVMTGIPSIVVGLFAYALFELFLGPGIRLGIMGSIALAVLMIPIVIRSSEEVLKIVPNHLREASYALGTPKWKTITSVVLPTALAGLVTGVMLAIARIVGETAPLLVTTGAITSTNWNPFSGRMENLAVYAFGKYRSPGVDQAASFDQAWAAALTLIIIVMVLSLLGRFIYRRFGTEIR